MLRKRPTVAGALGGWGNNTRGYLGVSFNFSLFLQKEAWDPFLVDAQQLAIRLNGSYYTIYGKL